MSFWTKLGQVFGGSTAEVITDTATAVNDIVERWKPSDASAHAMQMDVQTKLNEAVAAARAAQQTQAGTTAFAQTLHAISEFTNHMMAPVMIAFTAAAVFGFIHITTTSTDPILISWAEAAGAYVLGARAITRDIPALIKLLVELRRGAK
jgi:hypothetical protein